jgi:hypothetical protein
VNVQINQNGNINDVLGSYLKGQVQCGQNRADEAAADLSVSHRELVDRAREMFSDHGYHVSDGPGEDAILIDLVAVIPCPICHRPIRVAICCAAHTYRADQEISEFHRATLTGYNARVYISPLCPSIWQSCCEYNIKPIDPDLPPMELKATGGAPVPLLYGEITGHEKLAKT